MDSRKRFPLQLFDGLLLSYLYKYKNFRQAIDFKPNTDDIFVVSYPKCGTTWTQYIVWEILNDAKEPPFVNQMWMTYGPQIEMVGTDVVSQTPSKPRFLKSHFPFSYIPFDENAKYIYIARNPYEVCVSYSNHMKNFPNFMLANDLTFDDFFQCFINGYTVFGDYFDHIISWFSQKHRHNVLFLTYEELKLNPRDNVLKIADFMGKQYYEKLINSNNMLNKILYYTDFDYMKTIPTIFPKNHAISETKYDAGQDLNLVGNDYQLLKFFNFGKVGYAIDMYTEKQIKQMNSVIENKFKNIPELINIWRNNGVNV